MNLFVYDDYVNSKRHQTIVNKLETRLTDLSLSGKIIRLNNIRNIKSLIHQEIKAGIKNIYIVGNNESIVKVITPILSVDLPKILINTLVFSIIPIGKQKQSIANSMGIYSSQEACNIILARLIKKIDLALVDDYVFINKLEIFNELINLNLFTDYTLQVIKKSNVKIYNVLDEESYKNKTNIKADDGLLDLIINKKGDLTYINFKKVKIKGAKEAVLDNHLIIKNPSLVKISDIKVNFIVGKNRSF
jgi:hypothetical protein